MKQKIESLEIDAWYKNQSWAKTTEEFKSLGEELIKFMKSVKPSKDKNGYVTHFFMHKRDEDVKGFFYSDCPMNENLAKYLIEKERVRYAGKKRHQGKKYKSWTFQDNLKESENNLSIRKELEQTLNSEVKRKSLIKAAIELKLDKSQDMFLNWMFNNRKFSILAGGIQDYVIREGKKETILVENVCKEFIQIMNELVKEEKIKVFPNGYVLASKNFKLKLWEENTNNPAMPFIVEEERLN